LVGVKATLYLGRRDDDRFRDIGRKDADVSVGRRRCVFNACKRLEKLGGVTQLVKRNIEILLPAESADTVKCAHRQLARPQAIGIGSGARHGFSSSIFLRPWQNGRGF
jgi:hypothetical protein